MQVTTASLLPVKQPLFVITLTLLIFSFSLHAESTLKHSLLSQAEYALIERDTATAKLILQYLIDHPENDQEKYYSQLRLGSVCQEEVIMRFAYLVKGDRELFWQRISARRQQVKKSLLVKSKKYKKRSDIKKEEHLNERIFSLNNIAQFPWKGYPPLLRNLYQEVLTFQKDFLCTDQISPISQRLVSLLLEETIDYFFHSKQALFLSPFYVDYKKRVLWLRLNQIKTNFFLEQLAHCPDPFIEQQLVETYDVFFFLQMDLLHKGLLNQKRKEVMRQQFAIEEKALLFYEDLYCRTENPYWLQKILQVTESTRSSLLTTRQPYYLSSGLLKDLGRSLLAAVGKEEVMVQTADSLRLIHQQITLSQYYQSFYTVHQVKQEKTGKLKIPRLDAIRQVVKEKGGSVLNFFDTEHYVFTLFIGAEGEQWQATPKTDSLRNALQYLEEACATPAGAMEADKRVIRKIQQAGHFVYQKLLASLWSKNIPKDLIIIPDGRLNYLSFETLFTQKVNMTEKLSYLLQYSTIRYYPGLRLLLEYEQAEDLLVNQLHAYSASYSKGVAEATDRKSWRALPGAAAEICAIETHFPTQTITQSPIDFTRAVIPLEDSRLLHLSMHAATRFEDREEPGLVFSDAPDDILFLHEIAGFPHMYPVLVLSACETGLGKAIPGEGIQSIGQQFLQTGSRSTIQSLNKVADASGAQLMTGWYAALANDQASDYALRQTKLHFLDQGDPFYQHPYFWGGFVAYGQAFRIEL